MSYKPFVSIDLVKSYYDRAAKGSRAAFLQLETLLKALELPECDTVQVKNIVLNDSLEISDEGDLTIYGGRREYALVGVNSHPSAAGAAPVVLDFTDFLYYALLVKIKFASFGTNADRVIFAILNESSAPKMVFGIDEDDDLKPYVQIGNSTKHLCPIGEFFTNLANEWLEIGFLWDRDGGLFQFLLNGICTGSESFAGSLVASTLDTISMGGVGMSIREVQLIGRDAGPLFDSSVYYTPYPKQRQPFSLHYYNFTPNETYPTQIDDLSLNATYRTPLGIQEGYGELQEIEVI